MILNALTVFHGVLSLIGIGSGVVSVYELLKAKTPGGWTQVFLTATATTSLTGVLFPFPGGPRPPLPGRADNRGPFDLSPSPPGGLAPDLCDHRSDGTLFQRFRARRPAIPPGFRTERHRADAIRAAFPDRAARRAAFVRADWTSRRYRKAATGACPVNHQSEGRFR